MVISASAGSKAPVQAVSCHEYKVYLEYDKDTKDKYGRTLAYVFLTDKTTMANREILRAGMAKVYSFRPNVKYEKEFIRTKNEAKANRVGFWDGYFG